MTLTSWHPYKTKKRLTDEKPPTPLKTFRHQWVLEAILEKMRCEDGQGT